MSGGRQDVRLRCRHRKFDRIDQRTPSSIQHMLSPVPSFQKLDIFGDCEAEYPVQTVQPIYRVTESFEESLKDL